MLVKKQKDIGLSWRLYTPLRHSTTSSAIAKYTYLPATNMRPKPVPRRSNFIWIGFIDSSNKKYIPDREHRSWIFCSWYFYSCCLLHSSRAFILPCDSSICAFCLDRINERRANCHVIPIFNHRYCSTITTESSHRGFFYEFLVELFLQAGIVVGFHRLVYHISI